VEMGCRRIGRLPTRKQQPIQATQEREPSRERLQPPRDRRSVAVFEGDRNGARLLVHQYLGRRSNTLINGRVASPTLATMTASRSERIETRARNPKWKNMPLRIEMSECINCDACLRHCPPQLGAIFNHGADVVIIPELCSGCDKCLPACPVNCIYPFPEWEAEGVPTEWWEEPGSENDPY
jgi:electron transport complex protein RnfB